MANLFFLKAIQVAELATIPFYLVGGPLVGFWIGGWIDGYFVTSPNFRIICIILGAFSGMRETWRVIRQVAESLEKENSEKN